MTCGRCQQPIALGEFEPEVCWYCYAPLCEACELPGHCGEEAAELIDRYHDLQRRGHLERRETIELMHFKIGELRAVVARADQRARGVAVDGRRA